MKKFYALVTVALMSVSLFATPSTVPTVEALGKKYNLKDNVVLCVYFDEAPCNTVIFVGSFKESNWSTDPSKSPNFEELDDFPGWYAAEGTYEAGKEFKAKPLQLDANDGDAGWAYQAGDPAAWTYLAGETADVQNGDYAGEVSIFFTAPGAYIYEMAYWKNHSNPCTAVYHNYTLYLFPPECEEKEDVFVPAINSPFSGSWKMEPMTETVYDGEVTALKGEFCYVYSAKAPEGGEYKFVDKTFGWSNQYQIYDTASANWKNVTEDNFKLPVVTKDTALVYDWRGTLYRYPMCETVIYDVDVAIKVPAGAPAAGVELMGSFIGGDDFNTPVEMELKDGKYTAKVQAIETMTFKLREAGTWDNQVQIWNGEKFVDNDANWAFGEEWEDVEGCETCKLIDLDWSNGDPEEGDAFKWTNYDPEEGIENVVLTEKARKVVVDGVLYIVRDNKLFNVQGAQIR